MKGTSRWIVGDVREVTTTSVVLRTDPTDSTSRTEIPFDVMRGAEVSLGVTDARSSVRRSAVRGALAGVGTSAFFYAILNVATGGERLEGDELVSTSPGIMARNTAIAAAGGAATGALIGRRQRERWGPLSVPRVRLGPARRPVSLSLSIDL